MIQLNKLVMEDIGKWVEYKRKKINKKGILKSWNNITAYVVFTCKNWKEFQKYDADACYPEFLTFIEPPTFSKKKNPPKNENPEKENG